jgi:tetratricopeptide (TPR) repeat protein
MMLTMGVSLATLLQPRAVQWNPRSQSGNVLKMLLGDGRRLFANHFFEQADVYFHSGYYPSIFDRSAAPKDTKHLTESEADHDHDHDHGSGGKPKDESEHEKEMSFLGKPHDWVEAFGRHFIVTEHTHLENGNEREILPWLKISAELDPQRIETYTVAAYWLRSRLGKVKEAEEFLREGMRNNPNSYEILFELGRLYSENYHEPNHARNVWELALQKWESRESGKKEPDLFALEQIALNLSRLEEQQNNIPRAINLLELAKKASPHPQALQEQIDELRRKLSSQPTLGTKP